jgi:hypothetical protein
LLLSLLFLLLTFGVAACFVLLAALFLVLLLVISPCLIFLALVLLFFAPFKPALSAVGSILRLCGAPDRDAGTHAETEADHKCL